MVELLWLLLLLAASISAAQTKICYSKDENPYLFFSSKTAYEFVKDKTKPEDIRDCEPAQLWLLSRHGTRYPSRKEIQEMTVLAELRNQILRNHKERQNGDLCNEDLDNLKNWRLDVSIVQAMDLTNQGHSDMEFIARRFKTRFPALLTQEYTRDMFKFRHTDTQRARASAEAFAMGLFGGEEGSIQLPTAIQNDTLIQPSSNCTTWLREVENSMDTYRERDLFLNGSLVQKVIQDISERLGFKYKLSFKQVNSMWDMCRYDKAWNVQELSPWCAAFTQNDLLIMEYLEDLKYYYKQGYGNPLNAKLGCPIIQDLVQRFSELEKRIDDKPVGVFYFTHSTAIHTALTALGIAKDIIKPLHSNYELMQKRQWKISQIGPFATNLAAVFFKCSKDDPHRVMFFLEERVVQYDGCNVGLCSWSFIKNKFAKTAHECNLDWCRDGSNKSSSTTATTWFIILAAIVAVQNQWKC